MTYRQKRIVCRVGKAAMAAFARDFEVICADGCKAAAFFNVDSADRIFSIDMNGKHVVDLIHNPVFHELYGTTGKKLFGLLKDEVDRTLDKLPMCRKDFGDRQKDGRMRVVTAAVHDAGSNALIREFIFFNKTKGKTYSADWVKVVKNSIATIAPHYTMKRQLDDYYSKFYDKQAERSAKLHANDNRLAKEIALWKETVAERWDSINVIDSNFDALNNAVTGKVTTLTFTIDEQGLQDAVGLELVVLNNTPVDDVNIHKVLPFKLVKTEGNLYTFQLDFDASDAGAFKCAVRMYPKNSLLPHRQDFAYVKWLN